MGKNQIKENITKYKYNFTFLCWIGISIFILINLLMIDVDVVATIFWDILNKLWYLTYIMIIFLLLPWLLLGFYNLKYKWWIVSIIAVLISIYWFVNMQTCTGKLCEITWLVFIGYSISSFLVFIVWIYYKTWGKYISYGFLILYSLYIIAQIVSNQLYLNNSNLKDFPIQETDLNYLKDLVK